jgi:hypothetical protein
MSAIKLNSSGGGSITISPASTASTLTLTAPATTGTLLANGTALTLVSQTASGTSVDFTGIPSWVKRITVNFAGVSTNGTSNLIIQIGDAGGLETTGYQGAVAAIVSSAASGPTASSSNFLLGGASASNQVIGQIVIANNTGNLWVASGILYFNNNQINQMASAKTLSSTLDRLRITTVNGTDVFDEGTINVMYEG